MSILVVDDSPEARFATRRALTRAGFEVTEAGSGAEGLAAIRDGDPDVVVLDVNLPDMSGIEVCAALRADTATANVAVLMMSAASIDASARVSGLEAGADAYLTQPVDAEVLVATVRALLRLRLAESRLRRQVADAETLRALTAAFADALTQSQVVDALIGEAVTRLSAVDIALYTVDERVDAVTLSRSHGTEPGASLDAVDAAARDGVSSFGDGVAVVPLMAYWSAIGAVRLTFPAGTDFDVDRRALLLALGERCGQAIERARLYEEQRHIAGTLQQSLLPSRLPEISGVDLAAGYVSGTAGVDVGGDFYDVFARGEEWVAVIGDVCGRGADAATLTSLARHSIRAHAQHLESPSAILLALNAAILAEQDDSSFLTAVCARLAPAPAGSVRVTLAIGGHPPPLVLRADGRVEALGPGGALIGAFAEPQERDVSAELALGDALVLYTDGVTEAHIGEELLGEEGLVAVLEAVGGGATAVRIADAVVDATVASSRTDDVAVLVLSATPVAAGQAQDPARSSPCSST